MSDPYVRQVGDPVEDSGGQPDLVIGVDYDTVTIHAGRWVSGGGYRLDAAQAEDFAALFTRACWEAARNAERMKATDG